ncbi:MAG TPA: nickel pincer cofactor biosynthesis protein LarC [Clostridia bacterium]|nr:nickel pincer cofactor biosynthesis protein LarC [Clostridia bacterium]
MRILYLDCFAGIAGDMLLGALLDAGADLERVKKGLESLDIDGYTIDTGKDMSHGITATYVHIENKADQPHRHMKEILEIIDSGELPEEVKEMAVETFNRIAAAEAKIHGTTPDKVHFHEVGAIDSICDIIGSLLAFHTLDVERVVSSPLPAGSGHVHCAHGIIPVPAPATLELLKGVPLRRVDVEGELVTPTGAALVTTLAEEFTTFPDMVVERIGYGMGTRDYGFPNILRAIVGEGQVKKKIHHKHEHAGGNHGHHSH